MIAHIPVNRLRLTALTRSSASINKGLYSKRQWGMPAGWHYSTHAPNGCSERSNATNGTCMHLRLLANLISNFSISHVYIFSRLQLYLVYSYASMSETGTVISLHAQSFGIRIVAQQTQMISPQCLFEWVRIDRMIGLKNGFLNAVFQPLHHIETEQIGLSYLRFHAHNKHWNREFVETQIYSIS